MLITFQYIWNSRPQMEVRCSDSCNNAAGEHRRRVDRDGHLLVQKQTTGNWRRHQQRTWSPSFYHRYKNKDKSIHLYNYLMNEYCSTLLLLTVWHIDYFLAGCALFTTYEALFIGMIGGAIAVLSMPLIDKLHVDDPVGATPVHGKISEHYIRQHTYLKFINDFYQKLKIWIVFHIFFYSWGTFLIFVMYIRDVHYIYIDLLYLHN